MSEVAVIGAGLAGLAAAGELAEGGHDVRVYEASDGPGGRVRTDAVDGFLLDRGFQILLTAYPDAQRLLDYDALDLQEFSPGAMVAIDGKLHTVGDPLRQPRDLIDTATAPIGSVIDKARIFQYRGKVTQGSVDDIWRKGEVTTLSRFEDAKFSAKMIDRFLRPLFAGITLDPKLDVTSRFADFVFRMLSHGKGAVPARGMGAIASQLATRAEAAGATFEYNVRVGHVEPSADGRPSVRAAGDRVEVDAVVVATDMTSAADLVGTPELDWLGVTTWWFSAPEPPIDEPLLILDGDATGPVNNAAVMSNVSEHYAPTGRALIGASAPLAGSSAATDDVLGHLRSWFGPVVDRWETIRVDEIPHAQPKILPGEAVPAPAALDDGVFVAGDHRQNPSINGALRSGRKAAAAVKAAAKTAS